MKTLQEIIRSKCYRGEDGTTMQREDGLTPNGDQINERWVLRSNNGTWIDCDHYRSRLADRNGFEIDFILDRIWF